MFFIAVYDLIHTNPIAFLQYDVFSHALEVYENIKEARAEDEVNIMLYTASGNIVHGF